MTKHERRLQALEHALLHVGIEAETDAFIASDEVQEQIADAAARYNLDRSELESEMRKHELRIRQIGWNAHLRQVAAELGLPLEVLADRESMERYIEVTHQESDHWERKRAQEEYWQAGVRYVGGVPVNEPP